MRGRALLLRFVYAILLNVVPLHYASAQAVPPPVFDVVAIHPMPSGDTTPEHITNSLRNGSFQAINVPVRSLMEVAFDLPDTRMYGGPGWLTTERFSVEAKADLALDEQLAGLPSEQSREIKRAMLKTLLQEQFKLAVHMETRDMPVYALVVAKGGAKLNRGSQNDDVSAAAMDRIAVRAGHNSLEILAYELSWRLGRPILDRTGVKSDQAISLMWRDDTEASANSDAPSLAIALQEQLGLKLETTHANVPVLLVDHAEKPLQEN